MGILIEAWGMDDLDEWRAAWVRHEEYLRSIRDRLPGAAREFAEADWHYNFRDPRCPHDMWLESLRIWEPARGKRRQRRRIDIEVRLLGAYHDGYLTLQYKDVKGYRLEQPTKSNRIQFPGHGDWLTDDIGLLSSGLVTHEVLFRDGAEWYIECSDVSSEWQEGGYGPETLMERDPFTADDLAEELELWLGEISESDRAIFERYRIEPERMPCLLSEAIGSEEVYVLAVSGSSVLVYDDVELEFAAGSRGPDGIIRIDMSSRSLGDALRTFQSGVS